MRRRSARQWKMYNTRLGFMVLIKSKTSREIDSCDVTSFFLRFLSINVDFFFSGVIAVVIFVILACLAVMARFFYRRKETFQSQESKGAKAEDSPESTFNADPSAQSVLGESQKEYFI